MSQKRLVLAAIAGNIKKKYIILGGLCLNMQVLSYYNNLCVLLCNNLRT